MRAPSMERPDVRAKTRLVEAVFGGQYLTEQQMKLSEIAEQFRLDESSTLRVLQDFQTLGMASLSGTKSVIFHASKPKEMQEAYEIRAALEEVGARAAARVLKGNVKVLRREIDAMRAAFHERDLSSFVEHDVAFHRHILRASENEVLVRVWDSLLVDLRIRAIIGAISEGFPDLADSHQPIADALENGNGRAAGLFLRNHVETILEFLKKSESDSGFHRAIRHDLEDAKDVQQAFFPQSKIIVPGLAYEAYYRPARYVSGDYYDLIQLQPNRCGIAVGDVSGKGVGAALLMASLQASLRAQAMHSHSDISALISDVDRLVLAASPRHLYASLFYGEFDSATLQLRYINAGHHAPLVLRWANDRCDTSSLDSTGTALGLLENSRFEANTIQLKQNDLFVAYTDGITESENSNREQWGYERLRKVLEVCQDSTPAQVVNRILGEVLAFSPNQPQRDDRTLLVIRIRGESQLRLQPEIRPQTS
jgi:DNA-binding GntR family transcriptional regulator